MKRILTGLLCFAVLASVNINNVYGAGSEVFAQHYEAGQNYLSQGQYSSAIVEFRKALRINYMDNSARVGLINSYLSRASYFANQEHNYDKAANDFRCALFYLKIFPVKEQAIQNSTLMITSANENLNQCLKVTGFDRTASSRMKKAEELRAIANLEASAYEYLKASESGTYKAEAYEQIAELLKILGNIPKSADYYKMAQEVNPDNSALRMKYARTLDKLGQYDDAVVQYNSALANCKGDKEILYALERIYLKKLAQTPSDAELNANIGAIKQAQGDFDSALSYYSKADRINPNNITTRLNVGTLYQQKKDYVKALKAYDSVLTIYPNNVQANLYKAQALSEAGDKSQALSLYRKVLELEPSNRTAKAEIIDVMKDTMSPSEFITYLSKSSYNDATMQNILYDYAYKLHKDNKINEAISAYKAVISSNPAKADAYINLGICYASINDYNNAQNILKTAKAKFPDNKLISKTYSDVLSDYTSSISTNASDAYSQKDYKKAAELYLSINPATEDSMIGAAASYQELNNYEKAIECYKKAESINPKNEKIPYYIGYLYSEQQKWTDSERYLKKSLAINPESEAKSLLTYVMQNISLSELSEGIKDFESKNIESAFEKFNNILKRDSKNAYAYYYRALINDEKKNTQAAINDYINVLKYTKELPIVNYMLAVDYDGIEKYKEAFKYYSDFVSSYKTEDEYLNYAKSRLEELKPYAS